MIHGLQCKELCEVDVASGKWEKVEFVMDSGAMETVADPGFAGNVKLRRDNGQEKQHYRTADGTRIPNRGEKRISWEGEDGTAGKLTVQITDVKKALCSVGKVANAGNRIVFEPQGGYIQNIKTGKKTALVKEGAAYKLKMWVKAKDAEDELNQLGREDKPSTFSWQGIP